MAYHPIAQTNWLSIHADHAGDEVLVVPLTDEGYDVGTERMPLAELDTWVADGRLRDARAVAGLFLARAFLVVKLR